MVTVKEANTRRDLVKYMEFPLKLYKGNPHYVPDILSSQVDDMIPKKNPAFEYCDAQCFLAYRGKKIVGRICAIFNRRANEKFGVRYLTFSQMDFIDDDEVVDALFDTAEAWGRAHGAEKAHGPMGFTDMDREGMLIDGFDRRSLFYTYYNYPYYIAQMERRGYVKEIDWVEYRITIPDKPVERIERVAEYVLNRYGFRVMDLDSRDRSIKQLAKDMFALWNRTYLKLFGVVSMSQRQVEKYASEFKPLIRGKTTSFVYDKEGNMVAFGIASPSLEEAQQKNGGRLFPFGWIPMLKALDGKGNDTLDLLLIAVDPELQNRGVNAVILNDMQKKVIKAGFKYAETGPMLENNESIQAQWKFFESEQHKSRRCWVKDL